jgi:hypothetical protein
MLTDYCTQLLGQQVFTHDVYISVDWTRLLGMLAVLLAAVAVVERGVPGRLLEEQCPK